MSTRYTLEHGDHHHLFLDFLEAGTVYLRMRGTDFQAGPDQVTVAIPLEVWRRLQAVEVVPDDWWDIPPSPEEGQGGAPSE